MDKELLLIDLLTEKNFIQKNYQKMYQKRLLILFFMGLGFFLLFFPLSYFLKVFLTQSAEQLVHVTRLNELYSVSKAIGYFFLVFSLSSILITLWQIYFISFQFITWLDVNIPLIKNWKIIGENDKYFYVIKDDDGREVPKKNSVIKKTIRPFESFDNNFSLMIGATKRTIFFSDLIIFQATDEEIDSITYPIVNWNKRIIITLLSTSAFCLMLSYLYIRIPTNQVTAETEESYMPNREQDALIKSPNINADVDFTTETPFNFYYDNENNQIFQTTNSGETWQEVPIQADLLRGGQYLLTTGEVALGSLMDKSFDISPDFSWYLYTIPSTSDEELGLYFLSSTDNGETWESHPIDEQLRRLRYRKAQVFKSGLIIVTISQTTDMSQEFINFYTSTDKGKTWGTLNTTSLNAPIQNASFISQSTGFIATRDKLYYTTDYGLNFNEAVVNIPDDYTDEGLFLFTSPNEIGQKTANTLTTRFNLLKTKNKDAGLMFECEFISTDGGATWNFERELRIIDSKE